VDSIGLGELIDGAARLDLDHGGRVSNPVTVLDLEDADWSLVDLAVAELTGTRHGAVVGASGSVLPAVSGPLLGLLTCTLAPGGPGGTWVDAGAQGLDVVLRTVERAPLACLTLVDLLGLTSRSGVEDGLVAESLAYSTLLAGPEYESWRAATPRREGPIDDDPVLVARDGDVLRVILNRPTRHNAFGRAVRDQLLAALELARLDDSIEQVVLTGAGPSFSSGGDLDEFGTAPDVVTAHVVRLAAGAGLAVHRLRDRVRPVLHGTCLGAGIEVPAFAAHLAAREGATFALPELAFGLVPGAGGTVSITRRIGRWRTAYLALSGARLDLDHALAWGLVDERV
jgi:hypothetical protein